MRPINPVNAAVLPARVTVVAVPQIWMQQADGSLARAWAPRGAEAIAPETEIEVYVDVDGQVNGWYDAGSGMAVNQRHLDTSAEPTDGAPAVCQGRCGLTWWAPAPTQLALHGEHCLTCAGPLSIET